MADDLTRPLPTHAMCVDAELLRACAYRERSDPLFFKWQRGTATKEEWLAEIKKINEEYP